MLIELATFPDDIQQQIRHISPTQSIDIVDNGKVFARLLVAQHSPNQNPFHDDEDTLDDEVFGILSGVDGVEYQNKIRSEWDDYVAH